MLSFLFSTVIMETFCWFKLYRTSIYEIYIFVSYCRPSETGLISIAVYMNVGNAWERIFDRISREDKYTGSNENCFPYYIHTRDGYVLYLVLFSQVRGCSDYDWNCFRYSIIFAKNTSEYSSEYSASISFTHRQKTDALNMKPPLFYASVGKF